MFHIWKSHSTSFSFFFFSLYSHIWRARAGESGEKGLRVSCVRIYQKLETSPRTRTRTRTRTYTHTHPVVAASCLLPCVINTCVLVTTRSLPPRTNKKLFLLFFAPPIAYHTCLHTYRIRRKKKKLGNFFLFVCASEIDEFSRFLSRERHVTLFLGFVFVVDVDADNILCLSFLRDFDSQEIKFPLFFVFVRICVITIGESLTWYRSEGWM